MLSTKRNRYQCSSKWAAGVEKPGERSGRAHRGGLGGPAVAVKPRALQRVSPAQGRSHAA